MYSASLKAGRSPRICPLADHLPRSRRNSTSHHQQLPPALAGSTVRDNHPSVPRSDRHCCPLAGDARCVLLLTAQRLGPRGTHPLGW
ncbi:hypothetical protein TIFTF001_037258 [Ficus carica]|uniref:Uncharacterized protein n=1 Tax=Ficus carica TaxID=3494 RepID=A0AA88E4Y2_FICCA|nr:hypothetical protein TIFTF001_000075 [Ficus carica]GMN68202.1 hypothetical protein TIFTF001_037258 [Ficus carica]